MVRDTAGRDVEPARGDPACWAHLLCPQCGRVIDDTPHPHRHGGEDPPADAPASTARVRPSDDGPADARTKDASPR